MTFDDAVMLPIANRELTFEEALWRARLGPLI